MGTLPKIKRVPTHVAVILTSFSLGALCLQYNTHHYQKLAITISDGPKEIIAQVISIDDNQRKPFKTKLCISITSISQHNKTARIAANAQLFLIKKPYLGIGDTILIKNLSLKQPVSQQRYLFKEGYIATAHIPALSYTIINHPKWSFRRMRASVQKRMLGMTTKKIITRRCRALLPSFLGRKLPQSKLFGHTCPARAVGHCTFSCAIRTACHAIGSMLALSVELFSASFFSKAAHAHFTHSPLSSVYFSKHLILTRTYHVYSLQNMCVTESFL